MLIDRDGNLLEAFYAEQGKLIKKDDWAIALYFENEEDIARKKECRDIQKYLNHTDFYTMKYMEGSLSEEKWNEIKTKRQEARNRYNELESLITVPTITEKEIEEAIRKGKANIEKLQRGEHL